MHALLDLLTLLLQILILALLLKTSSRLRALSRLLSAPPVRAEFLTNPVALLDTDWTRNAFPPSIFGAPAGPPERSRSASRAMTALRSAIRASTAASGRWTPTSGSPTAGGTTPSLLSWQQFKIKTSSPTEAGSTEGGSPGSAPASSGSTPRTLSRPITRDEIIAQGYEPICAPTLRDSRNCHLHGHVRGEKLPEKET